MSLGDLHCRPGKRLDRLRIRHAKGVELREKRRDREEKSEYGKWESVNRDKESDGPSCDGNEQVFVDETAQLADKPLHDGI